MTKKEKLFSKIVQQSKTFTYSELRTLLNNLGYKELTKGKTSGSRIAFYNQDRDHLIRLHKPHPGNELKRYQIHLICEELKSQGYIS